MPVTINIDIKGDKELAAKLRQVESAIRRTAMAGGMQDATKYVATNAAVYPPASKANAPPPPYYIRGKGTQYEKYNRGESEQLGDHWERGVSERGDGVQGVVENKTSYAPWVHSVVRQRWFHKINNWRNIERIKNDVEQGVVQIFRSGVEKVLKIAGF